MNRHRLAQPTRYKSRTVFILSCILGIAPWAAGPAVGIAADILLLAFYYAVVRQVAKTIYDAVDVCEDYRAAMVEAGNWSEENEELYWNLMRMTHGHDLVDAIEADNAGDED